MDIKTQIELFHLLFLEQLGLKLDKRLYALKGGCNLRFFLNSIRYSEDIDFDVKTVAVSTLEKLVSKILDSAPFQQNLRSRSLSLSDFSTPKQTSTTQRWKIRLKTPQGLDLNTKIEFSLRNEISNALLEPIATNINLKYSLRPSYVSHYPANVALQQKILALALRTETQARDIFDIDLLLQQGAHLTAANLSKTELTNAIQNTHNISFADFKSQVVSYLENPYIKQYSDQAIWDAMVIKIIDFIEKIS